MDSVGAWEAGSLARWLEIRSWSPIGWKAGGWCVPFKSTSQPASPLVAWTTLGLEKPEPQKV